MDAIYIGSSNCYAYWNPVIGWDAYGIVVYPYISNAQPLFAAEHLIKETRKTQKYAVYIINTVNDKAHRETSLHYLLDYMPFSLNKISLIHYLCDLKGCSLAERLEFFFTMRIIQIFMVF